MGSSTNLFGFKLTEPDSGVNATLVLEKVNKEFGEYVLEKKC